MAKADVVAMYNHQRMQERMVNLITEYGQYASMHGTGEILEEFDCNKGDYLIPMLSQHPNWDAENLHIVFSADYERQFNRQGIVDFMDWLESVFTKTVCVERKTKINGLTRDKYYDLVEKTDELHSVLYRLIRAKDILGINQQSLIGNHTFEELKLEEHLMNCETMNIRRQFETCGYNNFTSTKELEYGEYLNDFYTRKDINAFEKFSRFIQHFKYHSEYPENNKVTHEILNAVTIIFPDLHTGVGTTITKLFRKIVTKYYPEILEYNTTTIEEWVDNNGELRSREKNINFESKLSEMADMISPLKYRRHTVISVNPLDYLTMSFGHNWASCHTIDKENRRRVDGEHYSGCYCSGTLSYMMDTSSLIFYTVDEKYNGNEFEMEDKMQRCVFYINKDGNLIVQSRVYPDGRDNGDKSLAKQFREVMQKVISDCTGQPNFWTVKKGTGECCKYVCTEGTHYPDYAHYDDCNVSVRQNTTTEYTKIYVGHQPIDPDTGCIHNEQEYLNGEAEYCAYCNEPIDMQCDDYIYCEDNGNYYCDEECAENHGVHYCSNDTTYGNGYHTEHNCFRDAYSEEWVYGEPRVTANDGNAFASDDNAYNAGYDHDEDYNWYPEDELFIDSYDGYRYHENDMVVDIDCDHQYCCVSNAEEDGCVYVYGEWYASAEYAEADGYHYVEEEDKWMTDEQFEAYGESQITEELEAETNNNSEESEVA